MRAYTKVPKKMTDAKFGTQATLILGKGMSDTEPRTTEQITKRIVKELVTRQDPQRVVAFYITVWKKKGYVKQHEIEVSTEEQPQPQTTAAAEANVEETVNEPETTTAADTVIEPEAVADVPHELPDLSGMKLSDAVVEVMKFRNAKTSTADDILGTLHAHNYEFKANQVNSALQALQNKNVVKRNGDEFALAADEA